MAKRIFSNRIVSSLSGKRIFVGGVSSIAAVTVATMGTSAYTSLQSSNTVTKSSESKSRSNITSANTSLSQTSMSIDSSLEPSVRSESSSDDNRKNTHDANTETVERHVSTDDENGNRTSIDVRFSIKGKGDSSVSSSNNSIINVKSHSKSKVTKTSQ